VCRTVTSYCIINRIEATALLSGNAYFVLINSFCIYFLSDSRALRLCERACSGYYMQHTCAACV
jgi:hypothetical protein